MPSNEYDKDTKELAYLILQHHYLQKMGVDTGDEAELLRVYQRYFPEGWTGWSADVKIGTLSYGIRHKENIHDIGEELVMDYYLPVKDIPTRTSKL